MDVKKLLLGLNEKPIAYYPIYRKITGGTTTGILLSQLLYWWSVTNGRKFYKQDSEIMQETGLTVNELRSSKAILKKLDFVIISIEGIPAKTNYDFDADLLASAICSFHDTPPTKQVSWNPRNAVSGIHETQIVESTKLYTETTTENTTENTNLIKQSNSISSSKHIQAEQPTDLGTLAKRLNTIISKQKAKGSELWADYFKTGKQRKISDLCEAMYAAGFVYEHDGGLRAYAEKVMKGGEIEEEKVEAEKEELEHEPVAKRCLALMKEKYDKIEVAKHDINKLLLWIEEKRNSKKSYGGYDFTGDGAMFCLFDQIMREYKNYLPNNPQPGFVKTMGHALRWYRMDREEEIETENIAGEYYGEEGKDADEWWSWTDEMRENVRHVERWVDKNRKVAPLHSSSLAAYVKIGRWIMKMKEEGHTMAYLVLTKSALEVGRPGAGMTTMDDIDKHYLKNKERIDREVYGEAAA